MLAAVAALAGAPVPAAAQPAPSIADQPAATLLLPYFEVDLKNPAGANTFFSVNNASATAVLAHVTIWSALHVPIHSFNIYLTGYDAQPLNVRDLINGALPATASAGQDPSDTISPKGFSSQDLNFGSCTGQLPPAAIPQLTIDHIRASLTGAKSPLTGQCASKPDGTQIARGYITVDTVNNCTTRLPNEPGYFGSGGTGDATNQNVLWGDYVYTNHLGGLESGDGSPLVHIIANATDPETSQPGQYTFYGRLNNWTAADNREPLSTSFVARFVSAAGFSQTTLTVWRDAKVNQNAFNCNGKPNWYPLGQEAVNFFNEQEQVELPVSYPFAPQPPTGGIVPFPAGTQRVAVGSAELPTSFNFGWVYLDLNTIVAASPNPPEDPAAAQAWVDVHMKGTGRYSTGWPGVPVDSAKSALHLYPGIYF
jgi:hypothetical protein